MNRVLIIAAFSSGVAACTLLAPGDEDLFGEAPPAGGGRPSGNGGAAGDERGRAGDSGTSAGGSGPSSGGMSFAGDGSGGGSAGTTGGTSAAGAGGALTEGGDAGSGGAEPACATACGSNEECTATAAGAECTCVDGFVRDGAACRLPRSCNELHLAAPDLPSRAYSLQPAGATTSFRAQCGMALEGGGWTLVVNEGPSFDPTTMGVADICYSSTCTNVGYAQVVLDSDVMIDMSNSPITNAMMYAARVVVEGVHAMSRGKTLRTLFTEGPNYVEAEDNSNVTVRMTDSAECSTLPEDMARLVCNSCDTAGCKAPPIMVFGDSDTIDACRTGAVTFAIGAATHYTEPWANCAGWPQNPNAGGGDFYPDYVRVWIR